MENFSDADLYQHAKLKKVRRGLYVMQQIATDDLKTFRFGAIGVKGGNNNALARLKQIDHGKTKWRYLRLIKFSDDYSCNNLRQNEKKLKDSFRAVSEDVGQFHWIGRKDRFNVFGVSDCAHAEEVVAKIFDGFVATNFTPLNNPPE